MFSTDDTIAAIATPPGRGGIGVIRISGPQASLIAHALIGRQQPLVARHATLTSVRTAATDQTLRDQVIVTFFPGPGSYTGEDVVELSAHGSPVVLAAIVMAAVEAGARLAQPGEFTLRAFLNGRLDLPQAEAVADLIDAVTPLQARAAFDQLHGTLTTAISHVDRELFDLIARLEASVDFPDEGYHFVQPDAIAQALVSLTARVDRLVQRGERGRVIREGRVVAIVGSPNVGKSSLFNALLGSARAIVTPVPGTTRDMVSETMDLNGLRITLVDTAGVRVTTDLVESEGIARSHEAIRVADVVVEVCDGTAPEAMASVAAERDVRLLSVANKSDLATFVPRPGQLAVSAQTGSGLSALREEIGHRLGHQDYGDCPEITNVRHLNLLKVAGSSLRSALRAVSDSEGALSEEFVLADLQQARVALEEISGHRSSEDVLTEIFERFCIGK